jgi:ribosomal protein S18 acetylase RimI-like enzyme
MSVQIVHGLPLGHHAAAALLYWQAFGSKLGLVMGPQPRALMYLQRVMQPDQCFAALQDGALVGILGYHGQGGSFAGGTADDLRAIYGQWGGRWRLPVLQRVGMEDAPQSALMIDGFAVAHHVQSSGIGGALLSKLTSFARARGYRALHLDVASSNTRACAFYQHCGFDQIGARGMGPLRLVFGFDRVLRLSREV